MSEYDQNYKGIQGVNYPADGTVFFQQDFMIEQADIGGEIIDRESDFITRGIIEGFDVTVSATAGCVDISAGSGRDPLGRRVIASALAAQAVPDLQTTILAISHIWIFEPYILDGTNDKKYRRTHSSSFGFYTVGNVPANAVQLFKVQRSGDTVTILEDLRGSAEIRGNVLTGLDARYLDSLGHENLVYNPQLQYILNDTPGQPDGYIFECDGTTPSILADGDACRITTPSDATLMMLSQKIDEVPGLLSRLKGKEISFRVIVTTTSQTCSVVIDDGIGTTEVAVPGTGQNAIVTITRTVDVSATKVQVVIKDTGASSTIYLYSIEGNVGFRAVPGLPCIIKRIIGEYRSLPRQKVPLGQLHRNGASLSTTTYSRLFSVIKYEYGGSGDTFKLPDFRGWFERGWADGQSTDPDRASRTDRGDGTTGDAVGTEQLDAMQSFAVLTPQYHNVSEAPVVDTSNGGAAAGTGKIVFATTGTYNRTNYYGSIKADGTNGDPRRSAESRSKNKNVLMTIVYA